MEILRQDNNMANRLTKEKAKTIANCFALNGFDNKAKTLIEVGYKPSYARCGLSKRIYDNILVKAEIKAIQDKQAVKTGYSVEQAQTEYEQARVLAMKINQPSAAAANIMGKCRLHGFDKDNQVGEKTIIVISPKISTDKHLTKQIESEVEDV